MIPKNQESKFLIIEDNCKNKSNIKIIANIKLNDKKIKA